jgi:RNA polymerase sigma-70 factor, ECF subfamily
MSRSADTSSWQESQADAGCLVGDHELLQRVSRGDRQAFEHLYITYHSRLVRFLDRLTRNRADLEEIINDALLIVWQQAGSFRGDSKVSTWIFGIAYRRALQSLRRTGLWSRMTAPEAREGDESSVDDVAVGIADEQLVDFGLSRLPAEQRLALILAYRMGYSCAEIAVIAGCPVDTVKTRVFYARRKLQAILAIDRPTNAADNARRAQHEWGRAIAQRPSEFQGG